MTMSPFRRNILALRALVLMPCIILCLLSGACLGGGKKDAAPPPPKRFPVPLFDGLWLEMPRDEAARVHPIRPALTSAGKSRRLWIYDRPGEYSVELTFGVNRPDARLDRIDVHFGANQAASQRTIEALARTLGEPEARRRKAVTNAYCDRSHEQFDTIFSDASQYVFVTECMPAGGRHGPPVYYLSVKKKTLGPTGPPTGYVPPPPPKDKDGKPIEEQPF
jgi:hypothetical protein